MKIVNVCVAIVFLLLCMDTLADAATRLVVATGGSGSGDCTSTPCTVARAVTQAQPGDTITLASGNYASQMPITIDCNAGAANGTSNNRITFRATNERQAVLNGNGGSENLSVMNCSYWTINGIYSKSADNLGSPSAGDAMQIRNSHFITVNRSLFSNNNRACNCYLLFVGDSDNVLISENEFYWFHRHAMGFYNTTNSVTTRNYANSRNYADIPGGYGPTASPAGGESFNAIYPGSNNLSANDIGEGNLTLANVEALGQGSNNKFYGGISIGDQFGALIKARSETLNDINFMPRNTEFRNFLVINPVGASVGLEFMATKNTICTNCSVFGADLGIFALTQDPNFGDGVYTTTITNALIVAGGSPSAGIQMNNQSSFTVDYPLVYGYGGSAFVNGGGGSFTNTSTANPNMGSCRVYVPSGSAAYHSGSGGVSRGAEILYQYDTSGNLTSTLLWDFSQPGANRGKWIAAGAIVAGVNDVAGSSLSDVHTRLGFGNGTCSNPSSSPGNVNPLIALTSPTPQNQYSAPTATLNVAGTASDPDGTVSTVTWICDRCGSGSATNTGTNFSTWGVNGITLLSGINIIVFSATDNQGALTTFTLTVTYAPSFPGNTLAGAWGFENNGTDSSGNGNTATLLNGATYTVTAGGGKFGQALSLDGADDFARVADANSLDFTQSFTFSAWVFPTAIHNDWRAIMVKNYMIALYASSDYCGAGTPVIWFGSNGTSGPSFYACYATPLPINQWSHLAGTYDGTNLRLYINGVVRTTTPATGYIEPSALTMQIGASQYGEYFQGLIDEGRSYNFGVPITAGLNSVAGAACGYTNYTAQVPALASVIGDMNCSIIPTAPPVVIKIPSSPTGFKVGAGSTQLRLGAQ